MQPSPLVVERTSWSLVLPVYFLLGLHPASTDANRLFSTSVRISLRQLSTRNRSPCCYQRMCQAFGLLPHELLLSKRHRENPQLARVIGMFIALMLYET